jgi:hypothetical protein
MNALSDSSFVSVEPADAAPARDQRFTSSTQSASFVMTVPLREGPPRTFCAALSLRRRDLTIGRLGVAQ